MREQTSARPPQLTSALSPAQRMAALALTSPTNTPWLLPFSPIPYAIGQQVLAALPSTYSPRLSAGVHALPAATSVRGWSSAWIVSRAPEKL